MNNDYGFENRKAYLERSRDANILNNINNNRLNNVNPRMPKTRVANTINRYHKQARFDNGIHMGNMHKSGFDRNNF